MILNKPTVYLEHVHLLKYMALQMYYELNNNCIEMRQEMIGWPKNQLNNLFQCYTYTYVTFRHMYHIILVPFFFFFFFLVVFLEFLTTVLRGFFFLSLPFPLLLTFEVGSFKLLYLQYYLRSLILHGKRRRFQRGNGFYAPRILC